MPRLIDRLTLLGILLSMLSCASTPPTVGRDRFPLDPREDLAGPFPSGVEKGWRALLEGDASRAQAAFEAAASEKRGLAARIGRVEAVVLAGRPEEALALCAPLLSAGDPTLPLLVACGEARAASGNPVGGFSLYRRAIARAADRRGLADRAEELRASARDSLIEASRSDASEKKWKDARAQIARALELAPESPAAHAAAGDVEAAAGDKEKALHRYREALDLGDWDPAVAEKEGDLALELKDYATAVSVFDGLAQRDPSFTPRAEEARLAFRVANWPGPERAAARALRVTRAGAATLVWWMYPEIREARVANGVIASDAVSRPDSRAVTRAVALGLLDVDRETHQAAPDARLTEAAAARLLLRLLLVVTPVNRDIPCLGDTRRSPRAAAEAIETAQKCEILPQAEAGVTGPILTRALDRVRAIASAAQSSDEE